MKIETAKDLFVALLADIRFAEKAILKALAKMAKAANDPKLERAFLKHREETEGQIERIDQAFESINVKPKSQTCEAIKGLIKEGEEIMQDAEKGAVRDAGLIAAAQKVEHYEIAAYGTLCTLAEGLGFTRALALLKQIIAQEEKTDEALTQLAEGGINQEAYRQAA